MIVPHYRTFFNTLFMNTNISLLTPIIADDIIKKVIIMKTLYVSDLDGTLLRSDQRSSDFTNKTVNELVDKGMMFSYATARSYNTSHKVTQGLTAKFPLIVYNGVMIRDNISGEILYKCFFDKQQATVLAKELIKSCVYPIIYSFVDGIERFSYIESRISKPEADFVLTRRGDPRDRPVESFEELTEGEIFYFTCIDSIEKLEPLYKRYKDIFHCFYQSDIYSGEQWLELIPKAASKANAVRQLAKLTGCERIVAFGDGVNDIDMFELADEAYAVQNADERLKAVADGIIASNNDDGVAKFLLEHYK